MPDAFRYCFRFCCDPGFNDEIELPKLAAFCEEARIDDVMVFVNVEELNTGHMDEVEQDTWLALLGRIKPLLDEVSVGVHEGERIGVIGLNGGGKTTLLELLAGITTARRNQP